MCIDCFSDDRINSILVMAIKKENCAIVIVNIPVSECRSCHEKFISHDVSQELDDIMEVINDRQKRLHMGRPYSKNEIPQVQIDFRGIVEYAHTQGKKVPELSDEEKEQFITDVSMEEIRKGCFCEKDSEGIGRK